MKRLIVFFAVVFCSCLRMYAQDVNLDSLLDNEMAKKNKQETQRTEATFKTTRLINGHTVETTQAGVLDLKVSHRFGTLNSGFYNMFGFDVASMRIGLDYGLTDRLTVGGGRSTYGKQYDGFLKYKLLWQSSGKQNVPISVSMLAALAFETDTNVLKSEKNISVTPRTTDKFSYAFQLFIARKFSDAFSLQLVPTVIHNNIVANTTDPNDLFSVGIGTRLKLTPRTSLNLEYYYQLPNRKLPGMHNSFAIGYEIETGGHVFQLQLTNSTGMTERSFITQTDGTWGDGDIRFGFNISRVFTVKKPKTVPK